MRILRRFSIRHKLMLLIILTSTVALLLPSGAFVYFDLKTSREWMRVRLVTMADVVGSQATAALKFGDRRAAAEILSKLSAATNIVAACIYRSTNLFAQYQRPDRKEYSPPPRLPFHIAPLRTKDGYLEVFQPIRAQDSTISANYSRPIGTIYLKADLAEVDLRRDQYLRSVLVVVLVSFGIAWLLSSRLEQLISGPIVQLAETTKRVSTEKDYALRAEGRSRDEMGDLINGFNEMLAQIQQRDAALQTIQQELERRVEERTQELQQEIAERKRTEKDLEQQLTRIHLLNQITHAISDRQDLESILNVVLSQLEHHLPADFASVHLADAQVASLHVAAFRWKKAPTPSQRSSREDWSMLVAETGLKLDDGNTASHESDLSRTRSPFFRKIAELGMTSAVALPLRVEGRLFGVLLVARETANGFSAGECAFLQALSEHVAVAAHHARLYTELQQAYNELRQTQHAVMQHERLRALGQMASGIAHDINNALSPVSGFAELLLSTEPNMSDSTRKYLQYIKTASDDVAQIVARLREFYRGRQGQQPLLPVRLHRLVGEVVELTRPRWRDLAQRRGIDVEVRTDLSPEMPDIVGIETELREALTNLIFNSLDAMPNGGTITIRGRTGARVRSPNGEESPSHLILEVSDTGTGMDEETRRRCFEPFFSTKGQRGTGLGLAMVYGTMQRHEGSVEVDSEVGRGTAVRLIFPVRETGSAGTPTPLDGQMPLAPMRILFIDDEPLLRELIREILECDGHEIALADGGPAGLERFRQAHQQGKPFDVIITDLGMPQLDGRELAHIIKRESPATPVIMMTGWGSLMRGENDVRAPVDGLVSKPPKIAELQAALRKVTRQEPDRSS